MITATTLPSIIKFCSNPKLVNYVCLLQRPGIYAWMVELEYTKFKPDTFANDGFHISNVIWPEDIGIPYVVVSFDKSGEEFADAILWKHGLRKVKKGFVATAINYKGPQQFPITGSNTFFLENHSKGAENVIYSNDPVKLEAARKHEEGQAQKFFDEHKNWLESPQGKATADAYWATKPTGYNR